MKIIAFVAPKQSGKSMLADYLVAEHGYTKVNFKDALIAELKVTMRLVLEVIAEENNLTVDELFTIKPYLPIIRALMKSYGTDLRRAEYPDYWVEKMQIILNSLPKDSKVIVDDCRFFNEGDLIIWFGGVLYRIIRPGYPKDNDQHQSETEQADIMVDFTIINGGTPKDLINELNRLHIS